MGIYNRDYVRQGPPGGGFGGGYGGSEWAIKYLLIANIGVFLVQQISPQVTGWLSLSLADLYRFQIWRLITYGFCHSPVRLGHIAINMFVLWMFGRTVQPLLGSREFLAFYLGGVLISGGCHVGLQALTGNPQGVVGASGGVMAVVFLTAMYYPRMKVLLMLVIPIELRWLAIGYAIIDVMGLTNPGSNVAHAAHLGGAAFGVAYKYYGWRLMPYWNRAVGGFSSWLRGSRRPKVRIYPPSEQSDKGALNERVDAILEKIQREGEASLTDEERRILKEASRRYRER